MNISIILLAIITIVALTYYFLKDIIRVISKEKIHMKAGCMTFDIINEKMFVWNKINDHLVKLRFDTGATQYFITDKALFGGKQNLYKTVDISLADNYKLKSYLGLINFENNLISGKPLSASYIDRTVNQCDDTKGHFSLVNFVDEKKEIELNFEKNQISSGNQIRSKLDYTEIDLKVELSGIIKIKITVDGKEDWFIFDTGALSTIIFPFQNTKYNFIDFQAITPDKNHIKSIRTFENVPVIFGKEKLWVDINNSEKVTRYLVGIMFIKKFNWILDFKNKKAYYKKIDENQIIKSFQNDYAVRNINNNLIISAKNIKKTEFDIGDAIVSVDHKKINTTNLCQMQQLLNQEKNWDQRQVQIKKLVNKII
ncbi:hypothetical protein [Chryseobacterium sp. JAH]|uniref:hypothetical protein n=1 Tax=Chryseobacterium sp. JAH TaxID=1742858 RepID=UPI000740FC14|nr:hypothetical protein [Chryseobacterium sp. JAH]KUJ49689.1 hypothetical protein AR685_17825 [Chryseobacterium sp. JAH]